MDARKLAAGAALLAIVIGLAFWDISFLNRTLLTSNMVPTTLPSGAYGYHGRNVSSYPVMDAGASAWDYEPDVKVLHDDIHERWLPLWNPYVACGAPFLGNMFSAALSPLRLLLASVDRPGFWDLYLLFRLFCAAFLTYWFALSIGLSFAASLIAGIIFALCGHFVLYVNMPDMDVQMWLPALLLIADKLLEKPNYRTFFAGSLLIALITLAGMPESAFFLFFFGGLYFLVRAWQSGLVQQRQWRLLLSRLGGFIAAGLAGLAISMPQVLPFLEYLRYAFSPRAPGTGSGYLNANTAISLILPRFFGHLYQEWTGVGPFSILPYVGSVCALLALAAFCRRPPLHRLTIFFGSFSAFYLLKAFGSWAAQWVGLLPLFNVSVFPKHAFPEFAFCLAMLAAIGAEAALTNKLIGLRFGAMSIVISIIVAWFSISYWKIAVHANASRTVVRSFLIFGINLTLIWLAVRVARARPELQRVVSVGLFLLAAAELTAFIPRQRTDRYYAFTKPPFIDFLRADRQPYRTFSPDLVLYPDTNAAYGIDDIRTLDPLQVRRYIDFLRQDVSPAVYDRFEGTEPPRAFLQSPLLDLMNVKYVIANSDLRGADFISDVLQNSFILPVNRWGITQTTFNIDAVSKSVLFQHPPSRIDYETLLRGSTHLTFALALDPGSWGPDKGDGVTFQVDAASLSEARTVFSDYIDPKNRVSDRKWNMRSVNLALYRGQEIYLIFKTTGGATNANDSAHWAQLPGGISESLREKLAESQIIAPNNYVAPAKLDIKGQTLESWGQHPPATVRFRLRIPENNPTLNFAIALDPAVWKPAMGDGVTFEIQAVPVRTLFTQTIDPKNKPEDRKWHRADIDLSEFQGQRVLLSLHTLPGANNVFDWAGWGDLQLKAENRRERFDLVYDHEVKIYRNNDMLPRAFVVNRAEYLMDKDAILRRLTQSDFHPDKTVILDENQERAITCQSNGSNATYPGNI